MKNLILQGLRLGQKVSKGFRKWLKDKMGKCVNCAKSVMQIFATYATYATYASANFVGKESNESTEMYGVKSRITTTCLRLASVFTSTRIRLASLICLCMLTIGSGNVWGETIEFKIKGSGASGSAYIDTETAQTAASTYGYKINHWNPSSGQVKGNQSTIANNFYVYNTTPIPGSITGIQIVTLSGTYDFTKAYYMLGTSQCTTASGGTAFSSNSVSGLSGSNTYFRVQFRRYTTSGTCTADKIIITYTPTPSCTAPNHVDISGNWDRFGGETISLTATAYSSAGTGSPIADGNITGWQWQKWNGSTWVNVTNGTSAGATTSGATTKNLQITNCGGGNSGSYRCTVSTGATCSTSSDGFQVKVYVLERYTGGTTTYNFIRDGANQRGSVEISLSANTAYTFKVHADNDYYGNSGTVNEDVTNWVCTTAESSNLTVNSGLGGTFTFTMDYSTGGNNSTLGVPELSITYPRKTIYLVPNSDWLSNSAKFAYYYYGASGGTGWTDFIAANECGMAAEIPQWNGITVIAVRFNPTKVSTGNWDDKWNQTDDITLTADKNLITITGWNNSQTYTAYSIPTYTISYAKGTVPTGGVSISGSRDNESKTCGTAFTLPSSAVFTTTGYTQDGWATSDGGSKAYNLGGSYTTNAAQTFYPHWNANTYTLTWNLNGGTVTTAGTGAAVDATGSPSSSVAFNSDITAPVVEKDGYDFDGWNTTPATKMPAANTTYTAQWSLKSYTVTWYAGGTSAGNITTAGSPTTNVNHGSKVTTLPTNPDGSGCDKVFVGWTNTTSYTHGTSLLFTDAAGSPTITGTTNFYAVYATENVATGYTYIGDDGLLEEGETYIFVSSKSTGSAYALKSSDLPNNNTSGVKGTAVSVTVATGIKVSTENSDLEFTCTSHNATTEEDALQIGSTANTLRINGNGIGYGTARAYYDATGLWGWNNSVNKFYDVYYNSTSTKFEAKESAETRVYAYKKGGTTYSDYTINCASCSNEVTVSYSAPGSGNTMTVAKGVTSISSGDAVKTCSAVSLTVTLTPAEHYTADGLSATGVAGVTTTNVGNVYTVNIPADATGTLTLTPTFTPETPLTITLSTNSKGSFTAPTEFPIYAGETFTFPDVTPNDPTCATFVGWIEGTTFVGDGTTHDAPVTIAAGSSSGAQSSNTTYTAVFYETETSESDAYVKVTSTPADWANDHYLIVYEGGGLAFDGSRTDADGDKIDAANNTVAVTITSGAIAATNALAASEWKIALISESNYSIQSASGKYIGNTANSNALSTSSSALANTLSISSGDFGVVSDGGAYLRYNATSGQERFRYYKSASYTSQQAIQLYKLGTAVVETRTYTTNPACTPKYRVTVASVAGGSPTANPKFNPEDEEVTLTANPSAGYTFTSWTITKTTGGDNVTSTLLTGDKPTTANTSFAMPAYDVTVTATYAKIYVTSVVAKEGETTLNTSDHKLNINTGANKTVTVVVTPADAFDHSWSAEVTSGGTYASISNVTSEGFRVNGLAQGDATITVTAPNDGDAKIVTFTVHVTDVLPEEIILKRDGSSVEISELTMYYDAANTQGQYVKVNVSYTPTPTNKNFTFSSAATGKVSSHSHSNANGYEVLVANGVTTDPVNCTFTSAADGSVTKVLAVTVLPILTDVFIDYIHGNATQRVSARLSTDRYDMITEINTPSLSDASDAEPASADCETSHYHLIGWLPQATAEALWAAGTAITEDTEGLVKAGVQVDATGQTWYAIWGKEL